MSKILIALGLLATIVVLGVFLPVTDIFLNFLEQVRALGVWGPVLLGAVYIAATVFMLPGAILYVYLGSAAQSLAAVAAGETPPSLAEQLFFWFGLLLAVVVVIFVTRLARKALHRSADLNRNP